MDKKKILEIESKKNNDDYVKKILERSNSIALITILAFITTFIVFDFINKEPYNNRYILLIGASLSSSYLYKYLKLKNKEDLMVFIIGLLGLLLNLVLFLAENIK